MDNSTHCSELENKGKTLEKTMGIPCSDRNAAISKKMSSARWQNGARSGWLKLGARRLVESGDRLSERDRRGGDWIWGEKAEEKNQGSKQ